MEEIKIIEAQPIEAQPIEAQSIETQPIETQPIKEKAAIKPPVKCHFIKTAKGCKNGAQCPFSHDIEDIKENSIEVKINCRFGEKCKFKETCKFLHDEKSKTEKDTPKIEKDISKKKTVLCRRWANGNCSFGIHCDFLHSPNNYKTKFCKTVEDGTECLYGSNCKFAHNKEELRTL